MYKSINISKRVNEQAKLKKITIKEMLADCGLGINALANMNIGRMPVADNLAKIADYLDCSVDYLLGRTDNPQLNNTQGNTADIRQAKKVYLTEEQIDLIKVILKEISE